MIISILVIRIIHVILINVSPPAASQDRVTHAIYLLPHTRTHKSPRLASVTVTDREARMLSVPSREHG